MIRKDEGRRASGVAAQAAKHLRKSDPVLGPIIEKLGPCKLKPRKDYFNALCEVIINQQLAPQAAASILKKLRALFPGQRLSPGFFQGLADLKLRQAGVSPQKLGYLRHLSACYLDGTIPIRRLAKLSDEEVIGALTQVKGIGDWTAHVFLIFVLNRPDVLAVGDLSLKKSIQTLYALSEMPDEETLTRVSATWRPYRSYASWYLWRNRDQNGKQ